MSIHPPSSDSVYDTENILLDFHTSFYCILFYFLTLETKFTITQDPFEYFIFYQQIVFERAIFIRLKEIIRFMIFKLQVFDFEQENNRIST